MTELDITLNKVQLSKEKVSAGFSLRDGVEGEYCKVAGGLLWKAKALSENKENLVIEFSDAY